MSVDFCRTGARFSCLILLFVSSGRKKARADCEAVGLCPCPAGSVPPGPAPPYGPEGRSRETKDGPGRKKALAGAETWACALHPAGRCRRGEVPCVWLRAAVWACVRAWAVPLGDCRALWP